MTEENYRAEEFVDAEEATTEVNLGNEEPRQETEKAEEHPLETGSDEEAPDETQQSDSGLEVEDTTTGNDTNQELEEPKRFRVLSYDDFINSED